jgi:hypothetical protein
VLLLPEGVVAVVQAGESPHEVDRAVAEVVEESGLLVPGEEDKGVAVEEQEEDAMVGVVEVMHVPTVSPF